MIKYGIFAVMALLAGTLQAAEFQVGDNITIEHAWSPSTPGAATVAAAYMVLRNKGSESERLLAASADIAKRVELHESKKENNVMTMQKQDSIEIPAGGEVVFQPGGLHVMFMGLINPLEIDQQYPLTLTFEKAGTVTIDVTVRSREDGMSGYQQHKAD